MTQRGGNLAVLATAAADPRAQEEQGEPRQFGPGSVLWNDVGDVLFMALTLPAFMLQAMHPTISAAVDRHSLFREDPIGRAIRSMDSVLLWVYGGQAAAEEGKRLRELHKPIFGADEHGERYSALDPEAYAWVHGTAFVTSVVVKPLVTGRPMSADDQEALYDEMLQLGDILCVPPKRMPATVAEYWPYYHQMVSQRLERTRVAEDLLQMMHVPPVPLLPARLQLLAWPQRRAFGHALYLLLGGGMTPDARAKLGLDWSQRHDRQLRALMALVRPVHARLPEALRYAPLALHARRHARSVETVRARATHSAPPAR